MGFVNVSVDISIEKLLNTQNIVNTACIDVGFNQTIDQTLEDPYD